MMQRIEEGAHTTIRPPTTPTTATEPDDHDGATSMRPAHLAHTTAPTVLAVAAPSGT